MHYLQEFSPGSNGRMTTMGVYVRELLLGQSSINFSCVPSFFFGTKLGGHKQAKLGYSKLEVVTQARKMRITKRANSRPGHIRGPPPNGTKVKGGTPSSNLEGSNSFGFEKYLGSLCVVYAFQCI
ncbi:hypothetical protein RJ641_002000 [Dillenia turbinata]|uniref:Uncharacterized protein n=1 Tax=Dillenia turbinata TaxID=194707 RepID=A0AAN8VM34_9MAGN